MKEYQIEVASADESSDITLDCEYELDDIEVEIENELYIVKIIKVISRIYWGCRSMFEYILLSCLCSIIGFFLGRLSK